MQAHKAPAHPAALAILHILLCFRSCQLWAQEGRIGGRVLGYSRLLPTCFVPSRGTAVP